MRRFTQLFNEIDGSNRTSDKVRALVRYFGEVEPEDAAWALFFLSGRCLRSPVSTRLLRRWVGAYTGLPDWLVDECYSVVGDLAETLALLLAEGAGEAPGEPPGLKACIESWIQPLRDLPDPAKRERLDAAWARFSGDERFVFVKLITGGFRMGVQRTLVTRALGEYAGMDPAVVAHRLMGDWRPTPEDFLRLTDPEAQWDDPGRPYPFFLAYPLEARSTPKTGEARETPNPGARLGALGDWLVEWKYDGIRAQLLRRGGQVLLWSRGEELMTERFPEIAHAARGLPDGLVLDGEILAWRDGRPLGFGVLQRRIGRKHVSRKTLQEAPVIFMAYDCMEADGEDLREKPLAERRAILLDALARREPGADDTDAARKVGEQLELGGLWPEPAAEEAGRPGADPVLQTSPEVRTADWEELARLREESRQRGVEGFMIKRRDSPYGVGRTRGDWWKWKVDPYTIDGVMVYAQAGHGRRAGLYTDFTFAVWDGPGRKELVTVCKAYSGLTDDEFQEINRWIKGHTLHRRGPVRMVEPSLVFEIAFEGINRSDRHKSGLAFRFPRMSRWRRDKQPADADTLETIEALLEKG